MGLRWNYGLWSRLAGACRNLNAVAKARALQCNIKRVWPGSERHWTSTSSRRGAMPGSGSLRGAAEF